jgi:hypothetical protein
MAKPRAHTLQARMGFTDPDLKTPAHDALMLWLDAQVETSLQTWLGLTPEWGTVAAREALRQACDAYRRRLPQVIIETQQGIAVAESDLARVAHQQATQAPLATWEHRDSRANMARYATQRLNEGRARLAQVQQVLTALEATPDRPEPPAWPGLVVREKQWEYPIRNDRGYEVGFIDLLVTYACPTIEWRKPPERHAVWEPWAPGWQTREILEAAYFEVKPKIDSLGELFRQLNFYRPHLAAPALKIVRRCPWIFVVSPDTRFADKIREQGYGFIASTDQAPAPDPDRWLFGPPPAWTRRA